MKADTGSISPIISETIILFEGCFFSAAKKPSLKHIYMKNDDGQW